MGLLDCLPLRQTDSRQARSFYIQLIDYIARRRGSALLAAAAVCEVEFRLSTVSHTRSCTEVRAALEKERAAGVPVTAADFAMHS